MTFDLFAEALQRSRQAAIVEKLKTQPIQAIRHNAGPVVTAPIKREVTLDGRVEKQLRNRAADNAPALTTARGGVERHRHR